MHQSSILIVEDEVLFARALEGCLSALGYDVAGIAGSGREALGLVERRRPDLVLTDIVLCGDMDGIDTTAEMKRRWSIPVVYATAHVDADTLERAKRTEPDGFIVKPFTERELKPSIELALYRREAALARGPAADPMDALSDAERRALLKRH